MIKKKKTARAKKVVRNLGAKSLTPKQARNVKGGVKKADGSLDAGIHFKY